MLIKVAFLFGLFILTMMLSAVVGAVATAILLAGIDISFYPFIGDWFIYIDDSHTIFKLYGVVYIITFLLLFCLLADRGNIQQEQDNES